MVDGICVLPRILGCDARTEDIPCTLVVRATITFHSGVLGQHWVDTILCSWSKLADAYYVPLSFISTLRTLGSRIHATRRIPIVFGGTTALRLTLDYDGSC